MPHSRFCSAKASANTSRPQPFAADIGVRKKPKAERGPKPISEMRQPHRMMTAGVRHVRDRAVAASWLMGDIHCCAAATRQNRDLGAPPRLTQRKIVIRSICFLHGCDALGDSQSGWTHAISHLLGLRIRQGENRDMPAASRLFSSPNMLKLSIYARRQQCQCSHSLDPLAAIRSCRPRRHPASCPPPRGNTACCRCLRSSGTRRWSARPRTSMSASRTWCRRSSGRSSRPT